MRPGLCVVSGVAASGGYLAVMGATYALYPDRASASPFGLPIFATTAAIVLLAGALAALVSALILRSISQAIESSLKRQKLEEDMAVARRIQQGLLPSAPPHAPGFEVAGSTRPAEETGGDYFDWMSAADGRTALTLADVTGHGIGPALLAANLHAYVHSVLAAGGELGDWVARLNRHMVRDLSEGRFVTLAMALLGPGDGSAEVLSAGHGPTLVYRAATGEVAELGAQGPPLGVVDEARFEPPSRLQMQDGDVLVLMTDGFFEQTDAAREVYGVPRVVRSLVRHAARGAEGIIAGLHEDIGAFSSGARQADDLTLVVVRRTAEAASPTGRA